MIEKLAPFIFLAILISPLWIGITFSWIYRNIWREGRYNFFLLLAVIIGAGIVYGSGTALRTYVYYAFNYQYMKSGPTIWTNDQIIYDYASYLTAMKENSRDIQIEIFFRLINPINLNWTCVKKDPFICMLVDRIYSPPQPLSTRGRMIFFGLIIGYGVASGYVFRKRSRWPLLWK